MLYYATVPAGLESLVRDCIPKGSRLIRSSGGAALIDCPVRPKVWPDLFTNVHLVLCQARTNDFGPILRVAEATASTAFFAYTHPRQSFRIRFIKDGHAASVPPADLARAEALVKRTGHFRPDRVKAELEFYYILRPDGNAFYTLQLSRERTRAAKGMLRPEIAYALPLFAGVKTGETVLDPFSASGAVAQALKAFSAKSVLSDPEGENGVLKCPAHALSHVKLRTIDHAVTVLPWLLPKSESMDAFYAAVFSEFRRTLKPEGNVVILSGAPAEAEKAACSVGFMADRSLTISFEGKKLSIMRFKLQN